MVHHPGIIICKFETEKLNAAFLRFT